MRNRSPSLTLLLFAAMILGLVACGPSNKEIAMAKQARYQGDKSVLFNATKAAVESKHKILQADEAALGLQTVARWYTQDGMVTRGTDENFGDVPTNSVRLSLIVRLLPDGDKWIVDVEPQMFRKIAESPQPQPLDAKDPSVPGWARGQVDNLQFEIYQALKPYEVKALGGLAPAPEAAPAAPSPESSSEPSGDSPAAEPAPAP
jgi:hypothetical protein